MKTLAEISRELSESGLSLSLRQLYRNLDALGIRPAGVRQCPQRYPADAAQRILASRGYQAAEASAAAVVAPLASQLATPQLVSLDTLKRISAKARQAKKGGRK